jgi:dihydrofolate reductase
MTLSIIAALDTNNAIGKNNQLLAYLPGDLKRFKQLTTGHTIIMGRKTYQSLPNGALPNRRNIVISSNSTFNAPGCEVVKSIEEAIIICNPGEEVFIIGGGSVYRAFLPLCHKLYLTHIHHTFDNADTFFPHIDYNQWEEVYREDVTNDPKTPISYSFCNYIRK